LYLVTS